MAIPYEQTGRTAQKARTRDALLAAVRRLLAEGATPTVEQAAEAAGISRTTAYRYFPNQRALLVAAHPEIDAPSLVLDDPSDDPGDRFDAAVEAYLSILVDSEPEQRTALRLSLEAQGTGRDEILLRQGRALGWFEDALAPLRGRLSDADVRRLALATRVACGIEALVWLTDVAGLSHDEALATMRWSARTLFDAAAEGRTLSEQTG